MRWGEVGKRANFIPVLLSCFIPLHPPHTHLQPPLPFFFNSFFCLIFTPTALPPPPPTPSPQSPCSDSFCQPLSLPPRADRQGQGDCCACSLTLSAHKSLSTACTSRLLLCLHPLTPSVPPSLHGWRNGRTH